MSNNSIPNRHQSDRVRPMARITNAESSISSLSTSQNVNELLARAAAGAQAATGQSTYEARKAGSLARIAMSIRNGEQSTSLQRSLRHITFHHEYDSVDNSGIHEVLGIDKENLPTLEDLNTKYQAHLAGPPMSLEDLTGLKMRFVLLKKRSTGITNAFLLLKVYGILFRSCNIQTVALPEAWLERFTEESLKIWFQRNFPGVLYAATCRYMRDGERYVLFGSPYFIRDRVRDGEEQGDGSGGAGR